MCVPRTRVGANDLFKPIQQRGGLTQASAVMNRRATLVILLGAIGAAPCGASQQSKRYIEQRMLSLTKDEDLERAILDYVQSRLDEKSGEPVEIVAGLSKGFLTFYASWLVEAEVMNGGFHQYFWNSSSEFAEVTADALVALGDPIAAEMMGRALAAAIAELPTTKKYMSEGTLQAFSESAKRSKLNALDAEFCVRAENFPVLRLRYVRAHPDLFVTQTG
jgi:hypothetical protein